ncbi:MAG TPA: hypothetical protein VKL19_09880, partial [Thermoanaerobaculia bacterium]|nr:hypothetical protein [Thermoanaerobaculia bacterium]
MKSFGIPFSVSLVGIATLAVSAYLAEKGDAIDPAARAISWGSGRSASAHADDMVLVQGGAYVIGDSPRSVRINSFLIDRHEVT